VNHLGHRCPVRVGGQGEGCQNPQFRCISSRIRVGDRIKTPFTTHLAKLEAIWYSRARVKLRHALTRLTPVVHRCPSRAGIEPGRKPERSSRHPHATRPLKREGFQTLIHARESLVFRANRRFETPSLTTTASGQSASRWRPGRSSRRSAPAIRTDLARRSLAAWRRSRERPENYAGAQGAAGVSPFRDDAAHSAWRERLGSLGERRCPARAWDRRRHGRRVCARPGRGAENRQARSRKAPRYHLRPKA
jgi:hypothetical protein